MHIDPVPEEQESPVIEEPEDPEPELQQEEHPQAAPDFAPEEANPSEEGRQALHSPSRIIIYDYAYALGFVWNPIALEPLAVLALAPMVGP